MATFATIGGQQVPKSHEGRFAQVETACVQDNHVLALSVNRQDIDRCINVIRQYGLLVPPVIGDMGDKGQMVLSGECEFLALREIGIKRAEAVTVPIGEKGEGDKLSLLLSSLKKSPNALSEGILINKLFSTGQYTQSQLGGLLGKSVSWVNKRISLATRLEPPVMELVKHGHICPHSGQEISRLPAEVQHGFAVSVVKEGLPKSSVEALVAAFNAPGCPDRIKEQIVSEPRRTLARLSDTDSPEAIRRLPVAGIFFPGEKAGGAFDRLRRQLAAVRSGLADAVSQIGIGEADWKALHKEVAALLSLIDRNLSPSPWAEMLGGDGYGD
jgi:ParB family chromosome partitioning protein